LIINALYRYYQKLLEDEDSEVAQPGFSKARVEHCLVISRDGRLQNIIDLRDTDGKKMVPKEMIVPEQQKRSGSKPPPNFMCDNCAYVLGMMRESDDKKKVQERFESFVKLHEEVLCEVRDEGAEALLLFLRGWKPQEGMEHPVVARSLEDIAGGGNLVFKLQESEGYLHNRSAIREAWLNYWYMQGSQVEGQCLVTGEISKIARLHPAIKKVVGAQSSGASIVSFNKDAFTSYGKEQSYNAPVSEEAAFGYTTALNFLLDSPRHHARIGDTTYVFWAEHSSGGQEEDLLGALFSPTSEESSRKATGPVRDPQTEALMRDIFQSIKQGSKITKGLEGINGDTSFYILGLAPNASRLAIRYWQMDPYIKFIERISLHYSDLSISKSFDNQPDFIPVWRLLQETAPGRERDRIPPLLGGALMKSILTGQPYPVMMFSTILSRIRSDQEVNYVRASMIKAYLVRMHRFYNKEREVELSMELNKENRNTGYLLGRLFALLEKAQYDANPGIRSTIRDSYFSAASATPKAVFPLLLRLSQHHISKAEYGRYSDKQIEEVISSINDFPSYLKLDDQGQFFLGYYQQRRALFTKNEKTDDKESVR